MSWSSALSTSLRNDGLCRGQPLPSPVPGGRPQPCALGPGSGGGGAGAGGAPPWFGGGAGAGVGSVCGTSGIGPGLTMTIGGGAATGASGCCGSSSVRVWQATAAATASRTYSQFLAFIRPPPTARKSLSTIAPNHSPDKQTAPGRGCQEAIRSGCIGAPRPASARREDDQAAPLDPWPGSDTMPAYVPSPSSRRSSAVEQLIRNQQVLGSSPSAGSSPSITDVL